MRPLRSERLARVISVGRNAAWIAFEDETAVRLASFRKTIARETVAPGDLVETTPLDDERVVIDARLPRTFALQRTTGSGRVTTMAANVDGLAIVVAFARPPPHPAMIDELTAFAEIHGLRPRLIFTKPDLADPAERERLPRLYAGLGYAALVVNPKTGAGIDAMEAEFADAHTLLIGQSGVGKSSLFRALGGGGAVGDVSRAGRGRQTTTAGRLHRTAHGFLIDSPGVGDFALAQTSPAELSGAFVDFVPFLGQCRFADCRHLDEPACAITRAVGDERIARSRYESYRTILQRPR